MSSTAQVWSFPADSPTAVQQIVERLGKVDCFSRVETERNERGTDERQVFHLSVKLEGC